MTSSAHLWRLPQPSTTQRGIGCIGAGFVMANCHLVAYRAQGLRPVAISSRTLANAQAVAARHHIAQATDDHLAVLRNPQVEVVDIAVPPDLHVDMVRAAVAQPHIRGILAQKPLGMDFQQAQELVRLCRDAGKVLCVNQNMRYDHAIMACKRLLDDGALGEAVLATIDMRAIPHWMPWQSRLGWCTLRIMSIHHLDCFRHLFGDPVRVFASIRRDPRTTFAHEDGICLYILEYANGLRAMACDDVWAGPAREGAAADLSLTWRVEGTQGMARGTIGWPGYPATVPSTIDYTTTASATWHRPRWNEAWFPDAFAGPMLELLSALDEGREPAHSGDDNLRTMALVDACYRSASEHRVVDLAEFSTAPAIAHGNIR